MPLPVDADREASDGSAGEGIRRPGWGRRDWIFASYLVGVPGILLGVAALIGYPLITGDDLIQNFPLEALAGRIVAAGHVPLYNAYLWSGTPLLAGGNAHALLPITLLFSVMSPLAAWVLGEVIVLAGAAVGVQLFLRRTGCGSVAAALGGASFGLGGFVSSQIVHIDFVAAAAAIPWALVALHGLACRPATGRFRHALLLCGATAWVALTGSPDIVIDAVLICAAYAAHLFLLPAAASSRPGTSGALPELPGRTSSRGALVWWSAVGAGAGLAIGALQWWPTALFIGFTQRSEPSFRFISGGSLSFGNVLELLVPHVLGGGPIGLREYAGSYPLAEVGAYPGTLALIAVAVMLVRVRRPEARRWRVWLFVGAIGLVLALGSHTPLEHLVADLPVAGDQRLPSRALITVALAFSLLLGYFLDEWGRPRAASRTTAGPDWKEVAAAAIPVTAVLAVVVATVATGKPAGGYLTAQPGSGWSVPAVAPALALSAALAVGALACFVLRRQPHPHRATGAPGRSRAERLPRAVVVFVLADLALFAVNQSSLAPAPASELAPRGPLESRLAALAGHGRVLILDPQLSNGRSLAQVGGPDLGVLAGLAEAGGYSSIMWGPYSTSTGTHTEDGASLAALANGTFASLGVRAVLVSPSPGRGRGAGAENRHDPGPSALRAALRGWHDAGRVGPFVAFVDPRPAPMYELSSATGGRARTPGAFRVISSSPLTGAATLEVVSPSPVELVRDVADIPGWRVTVRQGGSLASPPLRRYGLVQSVRVPAGTSLVSFSYAPPGWGRAVQAAAAGALAAAGLLLADLTSRRRRSDLADGRPAKAHRREGQPLRALHQLVQRNELVDRMSNLHAARTEGHRRRSCSGESGSVVPVVGAD